MKHSEKGRKNPVFFTEKTFVQLLKHTNKMKHKIAFLLAFESGLRIAEVLALKKEDFDFETNQIQVRQGKNSKDRVVPLPRDWLPHMINYIPIGIVNRTLQEALYGAVKRAGLNPELHFHSLRHGFATHLHTKGHELEDIGGALGHQDISTTMVYTHIDPQARNKRLREGF